MHPRLLMDFHVGRNKFVRQDLIRLHFIACNPPRIVSAHADAVFDALSSRYRFEREIGVGGMARVYLAEDLKHRRRVAVKVLRPELTAGVGADRFVQEIEIIARLRHPHILPLYDSGDAGGALYYVMPYVEGESLRGRLAREGRSPR